MVKVQNRQEDEDEGEVHQQAVELDEGASPITSKVSRT